MSWDVIDEHVFLCHRKKIWGTPLHYSTLSFESFRNLLS